MLVYRCLLACILISCVHNPYFPSETEHPVRFCGKFPMVVVPDVDFPKGFRDSIKSSVKYWNNVTSRELFRYTESFDVGDSFVIPVMTTDYSRLSYAFTLLRWDKSGCLHLVGIFMREPSFNKNLQIFETIVRHELGHTLGLDHSENGLMFALIDDDEKHPKRLVAQELKNLMKLYNWRENSGKEKEEERP